MKRSRSFHVPTPLAPFTPVPHCFPFPNVNVNTQSPHKPFSSSHCLSKLPVQTDKRETKMNESHTTPQPISSTEGGSSLALLMENLLGLLRIRVKRGVNLAVRDVCTSDPYVVVKLGRQKLKTRVINKDINPEWNEDLTLSITDPNIPVKLTVYDHDTFSKDDKMGDAEFDIKPFIEALKMNLAGHPSGTIVTRIQPCRTNCLSEESCIVFDESNITQDLCLRLRNVECGEVEIQLQWIDLPGSKRF